MSKNDKLKELFPENDIVFNGRQKSRDSFKTHTEARYQVFRTFPVKIGIFRFASILTGFARNSNFQGKSQVGKWTITMQHFKVRLL